MTKVLPTLDESEPVDGDVATVHELIESHDVRTWKLDYGWMDGRTDGCMDGWMDGLMDGWMDG